MAECRICLDGTPPLLENVCACRGSQQWIHAACLLMWMQEKPTTVCDVCHVPFAFAHANAAPRYAPLRPWGESVLFTERFQWSMNFLLLFLFLFSPLNFLLVPSQQSLFGLYTLSYLHPLLTAARTQPLYAVHWLRLWLRLPTGRYIFPLPALCFFFIPFYTPFIYAMAAYWGIWRIHVGILITLQHQQNHQQEENIHLE